MAIIHMIILAKINKIKQIYGIDVSSGAVVYALDCQPGDNVLDVCCAPGIIIIYLFIYYKSYE